MFKNLLLMSGALVGLLSLALLPILYRVRTVAPPQSLVVFGICLAAAPLVALGANVLR